MAPGDNTLDVIGRFMEEQGAAWGMRREVISRATDSAYEFVMNAGVLELRSLVVKIVAQFDEFHLDLEIEYDGPPITMSDRMPTVEELANGTGVAMMSQYMIRELADQVRVKKAGEHSILQLHFEH